MVKRVLIPVVLAFVALNIFLACEEKIFYGDVDCGPFGCFLEKPDSVDLVLNWTQESDDMEIPVLLYEGSIDEGRFIDTFYIFEDPAYIYVKANEEYSIRALYKVNNQDIWVVDGTTIKLKRVTDYCEKGDCWMPNNVDLDLELKYEEP